MKFKQKLHSLGWFILINSLVCMVIASRYFAFLPEFPSEPLGVLFILFGTFGQMVLLAALFGLLSTPLLFIQRDRTRNLLQALFGSLGIAVLFIDTLVFAQYRFHINAVVLELVLSGQVVSFPLITWVTVIGGVCALLAVQYLLVAWLERPASITKIKLGRKFALVTFISLLATHGIHIWAAANAYQPVTVVKRYLPLFYPATSNSMMKKYGWIDEEAIARQKSMKMDRKSGLNYPLSPLKKEKVEKPVNIMFLVVDSWRADTFNKDNTPNMWKYAQQGQIFNNHIASGNATRTGIFGLFYGIPGTYWHAALANLQSPLLMDRLQELDYEIGVFTAAQLEKPEFNHTVFNNIPDLRIGSQGNRPSALDKDLTKDWLEWYSQRNESKPAFSFLFYDAPHGYDFPKGYPKRYEPMLNNINYLELNNESDPTPFFNRYKTSVHFVDSLVGKVFDKLEQTGDLDNTVIVITGDHGQEMNDNRLNFWGHNSNFTNAQVKVPFVILGPEVNGRELAWSSDDLTSHQDVVPTLMRNYLGVTSDLNDYTVGEDLLGEYVKRDWIMSSNYSGYAIIDNESILEVGATGQYQLLDKTNRLKKDADLNYKNLQEALEQISRFSK